MKILLKTSWSWALEILCPLLKCLEMMKLVMDQTVHHHKHLLLIKIQLLIMRQSSKHKNKTLLNPMWLQHHKLMMRRNLKKINRDRIHFGEDNELVDGSALDDEPNVVYEPE